MIRAIRNKLGAKLFISYLLVLLIAVFILVSATQVSLPGAFDRHLAGMADKGGFPQSPHGMGPGGRAQGMMPDLYRGFRDSFNEALAVSVVVATMAALGVSLFFSRSVVAPLRAMMQASQRIAEGHYAERVRIDGHDELAQLGVHFNQMTERLEQTEQMRRQLIGDVSHELRTPLTTIKGMMEGLVDGVLPGNADTYELIHKEADRLIRLVEDLQELSRVEAGADPIRLTAVDVTTLLATLEKRFRAQFAAKGVGLSCRASSGLPPVSADEDRLLQVMVNLVGNALQYTPNQGTVTVTASLVGRNIEIKVADTGIGISPEHLPHIFTRFYRADPSRSRQSGGSGIGLTVARHLIEAQGGRLVAASDGEGQGSTFIVMLPGAAGTVAGAR